MMQQRWLQPWLAPLVKWGSGYFYGIFLESEYILKGWGGGATFYSILKMPNFRLKMVSFIIWKTTQIMSFIPCKRLSYQERHLKSFLVWQTIATDIKGKGLSCYWKGTGYVVVRVVGLLASPFPLHPSLFNLVLKSRIDPKDTISLSKGSFLTKCEH